MNMMTHAEFPLIKFHVCTSCNVAHTNMTAYLMFSATTTKQTTSLICLETSTSLKLYKGKLRFFNEGMRRLLL